MKRIVKRFSDLVRRTMSPESQSRIAEGAQKIVQEMTDTEVRSVILTRTMEELIQRTQSLSHTHNPADIASVVVRSKHLLEQLEQMNEQHVCNMCGELCSLGPQRNKGGLVNQTVDGNYDSTPGNGQGALDDCTSYRFSLCEFCLD